MYQPILKGKKGEIRAWEKVSAKRRRHMVPLFEIVSENGPEADLRKFYNYLAGAIMPGDVIAVDAIKLGAFTGRAGEKQPYSWLKDALEDTDITFRPVIHLEDNGAVISDAKTAAYDGIVLRIGGSDGEPDREVWDLRLNDWCKTSRVATTEVHLLIDFESIHGFSPHSQESVAGAYLRWAYTNGPWASVTLASGAFPPQITSTPKGTPVSIPRGDTELWNLAKKRNPAPNLRYGDYGVRHPALSTSGFGGPLPNLRYTAAKEWIVWRESRDQKYPNGSFFHVCAGIAGHRSFMGATFSWADAIIQRKSSLQPGAPGQGGGTEWITYGMNHHFELVVDRLTNGGDA